MPIYNSRDIIPFINDLERKMNTMTEDLRSWNEMEGQVIANIPQISSNKNRSLTALMKAEEALTELNTATFSVNAKRGQRLKTLLDDLKKQVVQIVLDNADGGGEVEGRIADEVNHAISGVDSTIKDGLKLDWRLREIMKVASEGGELGAKEFLVPYKYTIDSDLTVNYFTVPPQENVVFAEGEVTVLSYSGTPILDPNGQIITGYIDAGGNINFTYPPFQSVKLYFPVDIQFKEIPSDFLYVLLESVIQKNSYFMQQVMTFQSTLETMIADIEAMKGANWTADYSIMRNHQDVVKESITPKGLQVEIKEGIAHASFSYNDHPALSHFILEKLDPETNTWVPYNGTDGIVSK